MSGIILYSYFRSSAAYRVRIALNLKGLEYETRCVNLVATADGEHRQPTYRSINPQGLVPTLVDNGTILTQSLAIIEYLDEQYAGPNLLPKEPEHRAYVRSLANIIACDIHPLNNLRVLNYLKDVQGTEQDACLAWYRHWIEEGFNAIEQWLATNPSDHGFCHGISATMADVCLIPQVYNAIRYECDLSDYPIIKSIYGHCLTIETFKRAAPDNQPDAKPSNAISLRERARVRGSKKESTP